VKGEDEELVCAEGVVRFEGVGKAADGFERGKEDKNGGGEGDEVLTVEAKVLKEGNDEVEVDGVVVHAVESDTTLLRDGDLSDLGRAGGEVVLVVIVEGNVVRSSRLVAVACSVHGQQRSSKMIGRDSRHTALVAGDVRRVGVRVEAVASKLDDVLEEVRSNREGSTGNTDDGATSHVVGDFLSAGVRERVSLKEGERVKNRKKDELDGGGHKDDPVYGSGQSARIKTRRRRKTYLRSFLTSRISRRTMRRKSESIERS
jgi:hypothetical protein